MAVATENLVAVEKIVGTKAEFIGQLLWYTLTDCRITREELSREFDNYGIDKKYLPRPINNRDAFRRSTGAAEVKRYPLQEGKKYLNLLVREVKVDNDEIVRQVVREVVDAKNKRLSYKPIVSLRLTEDVFAADVHESLSEFEQKCIDKVTKQYGVNKNHYEGSHIRATVKAILSDCYPISVRPSGGVLFVPKQHEETIEGVKNIIRAMNHYSVTSFDSRAWTVPVVDLNEQREMVEASLEDQVRKESDDLIKDMKKALGQDKVGSRAVQTFVNRAKGLRTLVEQYEEMLEFESAKAQSAIEIVMQQAMALMEKVDDSQQVLF